MALLTDRTLAASSAITASTLIHIVDVNDFSQSVFGSSYKAELGQLISLFSGATFSGGSGNCITDLYVKKIHSCSPLFINPLDEGDVYFGSNSGVTIDILNGGRLGIGTQTPSKKLTVDGGDVLIYGLIVGRGGGALISNTALGANALLSNTTGNANTALGNTALINNTIGTKNTAIGTSALYNNQSGISNTAVGYLSLNFNIGGYYNTAVGDGSNSFNFNGSGNTSVGFNSLGNNNQGNYNVALGLNALDSNGLGNYNIAIGYNSDTSPGLTNAIAIGYNTVVSTSNSMVLGNGVNVGIGTSSPSEKLDVSGRTKTENFTMLSGASTGYVLTSIDNLGTSSWQPLSSLSGSSVISVTGVTTSAYTATTSYSYYGVTNLGGTSIEIPDPSGIDGYTIRIKDETGTASLNPITITPSSGNIDGNPSVTMSINYMSLTMVARNNNWWII